MKLIEGDKPFWVIHMPWVRLVRPMSKHQNHHGAALVVTWVAQHQVSSWVQLSASCVCCHKAQRCVEVGRGL